MQTKQHTPAADSDQCCSKEITGAKKKVAVDQGKAKSKDHEVTEHESPEVHNGDKDPRF